MSRSWCLVGALAGLALLLGPAAAVVGSAESQALSEHELAAEAILSFAAGLALVKLSRSGGKELFEPRAAPAIWLLLLPHVAVVLLGRMFSGQRDDLPAGDILILQLAAPLCLALLAAAERIRFEVPRATAAAGIAGIATVFLALPSSAYALTPFQVPMLAVRSALELITVYSWAFAADRISSVKAADLAGRFLLLRAAFDGFVSAVVERTSFTGAHWPHALALLAADAMVTAAAMLLWFWLLKQMPLAGFALHPLAIWAASLVGGAAFSGLAHWKLDTASGIALIALWAGLRARVADERPLALELG